MQGMTLSKRWRETILKKIGVWLQDPHQKWVPIHLINVYLREHKMFESTYGESSTGQTWVRSQRFTTCEAKRQTFKPCQNLNGLKNMAKVLTNARSGVTPAIFKPASWLYFWGWKLWHPGQVSFKSSLQLLMHCLEWGSLYCPSCLFQARANPSIISSLVELHFTLTSWPFE